MKRVFTNGFTMIELLVVITIMVILLGTAIMGFRGYARYQEYDAAVSGVLSVLNDARAEARAAQSDRARGVRFTTNSITQFSGTTYVAGANGNVTYTYPNVQITTVFSTGGSEVYFNPVTGLPDATGTVTIVGTIHQATTTITISGAGVIQ